MGLAGKQCSQLKDTAAFKLLIEMLRVLRVIKNYHNFLWIILLNPHISFPSYGKVLIVVTSNFTDVIVGEILYLI